MKIAVVVPLRSAGPWEGVKVPLRKRMRLLSCEATKKRSTAGLSPTGENTPRLISVHRRLTVVSLEILTVLGAGPLCCYIINQLIMHQEHPTRHYWIIVLSTAELYGG